MRRLCMTFVMAAVAATAFADPTCRTCLPTTTFQGLIEEITVDGDTAIVWKLSEEVLPVVCKEPGIYQDACGVQPIGDPVCGTGRIAWYDAGPYPPGYHLMVSSLEPCP